MNKNSGIITICKKCRYCEPATLWADPFTYLCEQSARTRLDFVSGKTVIDKEFCKNINTDGRCPNFDKS